MSSNTWKKNFSNNGSILIEFLFYSLVSLFLFLLTTNGWMGFFYFIFGVPFYTGFLLILFVISFFRSLAIHQKNLYITLGIQAFILLFNFGDCGDAYGGGNFIQRLLKGHVLGGSCQDFEIYSPIIAPGIILILLVIYIFSIFFMFFDKEIQNIIVSFYPRNIIKNIIRIWKYGP